MRKLLRLPSFTLACLVLALSSARAQQHGPVPPAGDYIGDPAHPVARRCKVDDRRFASNRPDIPVYKTEPLEESVTIAVPDDFKPATEQVIRQRDAACGVQVLVLSKP